MTREHAIENYRNFGIMAHIDAGKTTTTERILFYSGKSTKSVKCMTARQPWTGWSKSKSVVLRLHLLRQPRSGMVRKAVKRRCVCRLNIIDTPGHVDFTIEVERSLRVLDGAIAVFDANAGVEPQTETVWRQADKYQVPRMCFVNKMDKIGADFYNCIDMMRDRLGAEPCQSNFRLARKINIKVLLT